MNNNEQPNNEANNAGAAQNAVDPALLIQQAEDRVRNEITGQQQVTSAEQFRKDTEANKRGQLITLGSGRTYRIARPSINGLVKTGQLPQELSNAAIKIQNSAGKQLTDADLKKYVEYNERLIMLSVVEPKIVASDADYNAGQINIDDVADDERTEIMTFVQGGLPELIKFRSRGQSVPAGLDSEEV